MAVSLGAFIATFVPSKATEEQKETLVKDCLKRGGFDSNGAKVGSSTAKDATKVQSLLKDTAHEHMKEALQSCDQVKIYKNCVRVTDAHRPTTNPLFISVTSDTLLASTFTVFVLRALLLSVCPSASMLTSKLP